MRSKSQQGQVRSRRGATIVLVAVSSAALLAVGALAVDTGMMFKVRADGQRAADAAALAGAAEFLKTDAVSAIQPAVDNGAGVRRPQLHGRAQHRRRRRAADGDAPTACTPSTATRRWWT